ncbi:MAG: tetratricopeptide repeat protein [Verrucomicrobiae bacterium]|nr:tetratricopeptide repeat protein [Verrucomicrobiae bacterium]
MKRDPRSISIVAVLVVLAASLLWLFFGRFAPHSKPEFGDSKAQVEILHPINGAVMPRNMPAPVVLWNTNVPGAQRWKVVWKIGDKQWTFENIIPLWRPRKQFWDQIKQAAANDPVRLTVIAYGVRAVVGTGSVQFQIANESVDQPVFYREVNLPFKEAVKDPSHIRWRFGPIDGPEPPPVVLEKLPVCGNCHSFSRNGEFLAMDVDYGNDKASYVITRTAKNMRLATSDIITWNNYRPEDGQPTLGLLSQISPDGRYVLSTVKDVSLFMAKPDLAFSQLFFPFCGIIGVYDRESKRFFSLPGADDPAFVQSNPTWSPDGKWIIFARTRAVYTKKAKQIGRILMTGDEAKEFLRQTEGYRYDLYRVPFNGGRGGKAEPVRGASNNGRSNFFPKYSPDGRWIVFCQASAYMLLQPDSELFIIPAEGGEARRLACNLPRMNSWHSWSADGRWLIFSSKAHSDYTQLYLARISENGEAFPPVWLAHMVDERRAANIPEFVLLPRDGISRIDQDFLDDYSYVRAGDEFARAGEIPRAIEKYQIALSLNPNNVRAHQQLGRLLDREQYPTQVLEHFKAAVQLDPGNPVAHFDLGRMLTAMGDLTNALVHLERANELLAEHPEASYETIDPKHSLSVALHVNLGIVYQKTGKPEKAEQHYRKALGLEPSYAEVHYNLGTLLLDSQRLAEAEDHFASAIRFNPQLASAYNCVGIIRQKQNRTTDAITWFLKAIELDRNNWQFHLNLANCHLTGGNVQAAVAEFQETLRLNPNCAPARRALSKILANPGPTQN